MPWWKKNTRVTVNEMNYVDIIKFDKNSSKTSLTGVQIWALSLFQSQDHHGLLGLTSACYSMQNQRRNLGNFGSINLFETNPEDWNHEGIPPNDLMCSLLVEVPQQHQYKMTNTSIYIIFLYVCLSARSRFSRQPLNRFLWFFFVVFRISAGKVLSNSLDLMVA